MVIQRDVSFFEELESAAKRLSVATSETSTHELQKLFDDLKAVMRDENASLIDQVKHSDCRESTEGVRNV